MPPFLTVLKMVGVSHLTILHSLFSRWVEVKQNNNFLKENLFFKGCCSFQSRYFSSFQYLLPLNDLFSCLLVCEHQKWTSPTTISGTAAPAPSPTCFRRAAPWWKSACQETTSQTRLLSGSLRRWLSTQSYSTLTSATTLWRSAQVAPTSDRRVGGQKVSQCCINNQM